MKKILLQTVMLLGLLTTFSVSLSAERYRLPDKEELQKILEDWNDSEHLTKHLYPRFLNVAGNTVPTSYPMVEIQTAIAEYIKKFGKKAVAIASGQIFILSILVRTAMQLVEEAPVLDNNTGDLNVTNCPQQDRKDHTSLKDFNAYGSTKSYLESIRK